MEMHILYPREPLSPEQQRCCDLATYLVESWPSHESVEVTAGAGIGTVAAMSTRGTGLRVSLTLDQAEQIVQFGGYADSAKGQ